MSYNQYNHNKSKTNYARKQQIMHASNLKKKSIEVLKKIKAILSTLQEINLLWDEDEDEEN